MTDDRHKVLALALAATGATEDPLADLVPDYLWDSLHADGRLSLARDQTGEGYTYITDVGREWLKRALR